jgi:hypothetical protein
MSEELWHYGTPHHSGRYPWGSGDDPHQRNKQFIQYVDDLKRKGMSDVDIAKGMGLNTTQLRANKSIAKNSIKKEQQLTAMKLKDKQMSNIAIGKQMGLNESSVRALLDESAREKSDVLQNTAAMLKDQVEKKKYLDIGRGTSNHVGVSTNQLSNAVAVLQEQGYKVQYVKVNQLGTGKQTTMKVLVKEDTPYREIFENQHKIQTITDFSEDHGRTFTKIEPPVSFDSKRVGVRWAEDGGSQKDGVIELRRGVPELSLGASRYAQVRIAVDGTHYLKGMAMYSDNLPDGVDMMFNTNKGRKENKLDAMKPIKDDAENPFGSITRQKKYTGADGKLHLSPLNIVGSESPTGESTSGEEGGWSKWSHTLSSQMLSKQSPALAKTQLGLTYDIKKAEFDEIKSLTNPAVKRKLLESFADGADASAVHLKAAGLPRTRAHVILPINSLKDDEIYAPNYRNGEKVVLIRHPHGGTFEIPELTVNNRNKEANSVVKGALDAVGINAKTAARLSGADFDGDTVLVIPNNSRKVKTTSPLKELKDFDPQKYKIPDDSPMKKMGEKGGGNKQTEMGNISNLITDMTIQGAPHSEIARAVKHSMVVIDAEKHGLDFKQSAVDNGIKELKKKYQGEGLRSNAGASTLISRASSDIRIDDRKPRSAALGGPIDKATGRKMYEPAGNSFIGKDGKEVVRKIKSKKLAETDDAFSLVSKPGTPIEAVYANHSNKLKALANEARKEMVHTPPVAYNSSANKIYTPQVKSLDAKLNLALRNAPLERQAQLLANATLAMKKEANPGMDKDQLKKVKSQALTTSRIRTGAKKQQIDITPDEWAAIQAGAISNSKLNQILANTDLDRVKALATPRAATVMIPAKLARAKDMLARGYTQADVADALGVPVSTLNSAIK